MLGTNRTGTFAVPILTLLLLAASCGFAGGSRGTEGGVTRSVTIGSAQEMETIDGILSSHVETTSMLYSRLAKIGGDGALSADLATAWKGNSNATEWTFTLRKDVKFSDGSPLTVDDIVWTFQKIKATPKSLNVSYLNNMDSVSKTSAGEVQFKLKVPFATWPRQTALIPIVSQKAYESMGPDAFGGRPVGSGPYKVVSFSPQQELVVTANKLYFGDSPRIENATIKFIADETTRLNALQAGDINVAVLSPASVQTAQGVKTLAVQTAPSNRVIYVGFNVTAAGLNDVKLRQAIDTAIDRDAIVKSLFKGLGKPIGQLVAPSTFGYDASIKPQAYDPAKARQLVQDSGYKGQPITLSYPNGALVPQASQIAQATVGYLKSVGINVSLSEQQLATFRTDWQRKAFTGMYLFSYAPSTLDADLPFTALFSTVAYSKDPAIADLLVKEVSQADAQSRLTTLVQISKQNQASVYYSPLLNDAFAYVSIKSKVKVTPRADGYLQAQFMGQP